MTHHLCPVWDQVPKLNDVPDSGSFCYSPRAGGRFLLLPDAVPFIQRFKDDEEANLSFWVYYHNRQYRLLEDNPNSANPPIVNQQWVEYFGRRAPFAENRLVGFLSDLIRQKEKGNTPYDENWLLAASGSASLNQLDELWLYVEQENG